MTHQTAPHEDPVIRRSTRVVRMVSTLHRWGFQRIRANPYLSSSGGYWRLEIGPACLTLKEEGTRLVTSMDFAERKSELIAYYSTAQAEDETYFGWSDAKSDDVEALAAKFVERFPFIAALGAGNDFEYAGWWVRLTGLVERGWFPCTVYPTQETLPRDEIHLEDFRSESQKAKDCEQKGSYRPTLPLPPPGWMPLSEASQFEL